MCTYSAVFLDIDGTLLNSRHQVMPCTKDHLKYLQDRGVPIVLCSARSPEGVKRVAEQAELQGPVGLSGNSGQALVLRFAQKFCAYFCKSDSLFDKVRKTMTNVI